MLKIFIAATAVAAAMKIFSMGSLLVVRMPDVRPRAPARNDRAKTSLSSHAMAKPANAVRGALRERA
jgi:hypothetical protein